MHILLATDENQVFSHCDLQAKRLGERNDYKHNYRRMQTVFFGTKMRVRVTMVCVITITAIAYITGIHHTATAISTDFAVAAHIGTFYGKQNDCNGKSYSYG